MPRSSAEEQPALGRTPLLYLNVCIIATCGLIYELLAGTLASYVLGDSVMQFSLIIGIYLSAMGVGSWLSGFLGGRLARRFVEIELGVALVGGLSAPLLFLSFAYLDWFRVVLYSSVSLIGILVGLELPLLMRILKESVDFKDLVARVLSLDYLGALVASLVFPLVFVPTLGLVRTSLFFGLLNALVGLWGTYLLRPLIRGGVAGLRWRAALVSLVLVVCFVKANSLTALAEEGLFDDAIVYAKTTPYQRIVITRDATGFRLFLNGNLQFNSHDEYRYHEALVHPVMAAAGAPKRVLVLGGGDGLAVREILRHPSVESVTLVDLDRAMTDLGRDFPLLTELNRGSLSDPRVTVVNHDAFVWLAEEAPALPPFDVAIVDFPDPNTYALGKLYTRRFYRLLAARLAPDAPFAVQATSPLFARRSYWCIVTTIEQSGFVTRPYQAAVPSFGVWGYVLARARPFAVPSQVPEGLRFLTGESMAALFSFSADMRRIPVEVNRLDDQRLVEYYENEWRHWQ
ncbi:polyamine aminopropyltransferase [Haliangium sp.]|uniref:polyamine aminopropyltransferase n=1 Tax=Haliangium sp. TaxID=2663208 RepID=UPI003D1020E5